MSHFHECPNCHKKAERDAEDEHLGAVFGGAWSLDLNTGTIEGGGGASYKYRCPHCFAKFTVHKSYETKNGISRDWETVYKDP